MRSTLILFATLTFPRPNAVCSAEQDHAPGHGHVATVQNAPVQDAPIQDALAHDEEPRVTYGKQDDGAMH